METWPRSLRAVVEMMLAHPMPMIVMWGPQLVQIYNDGYAAMAGGKHPAALGQPTRECWPEVWHLNGPIYERVLRGESVSIEDQLFPIARDRAIEDAWFTLQFGPLRDDAGRIEGFLLTATETTARVLAERDQERRQAERALREAEELHRFAAEAGRTGSWYVLPDTGQCILSPMMARLMGFPPDRRTATAEQWRQRVHPEHRAGLDAALAAAVERDAPFDHEFRIVLDDGSERWLYSHGAVVREDGSGRPLRLHGASVDVTERRRAAEQLRRSHETFYNLIQNNPFGVYVIDADFKLRQVSRGSQQVFENVRPLLGRDFAEVLRAIWAEPFATEAVGRFRHTLETGEPFASPSTVERREDTAEVEAYDWRIERITLPDGRFGVVCYFYDLSERQKWEAALRESEQRLRAVFQQTQAGIAQVDLGGRFVLVNDRYCQMVGRPREQLVGMGMQDITHPVDLPRNLELFAAAVRSGEPFVIEKRYVRPDGSHVWVSNSVSVLKGADGTPTGVIAASVDVTDRKRAEQALRESEARYRTLFESIDDGFCVIEVLFDDAGRANDYRFLEVNPAFERQTGIAGATGRLVREIVPGHEEHWSEVYGRVARSGEPARFENKADALGRVFEVYAFRVGEPHERKVAVLFNDITQRRLAEETLRESEVRFRNMADTAPAMLWVTEPDGYCSFLSRGWYEFTGQTEETGLGFGWTNAAHPDDRDAARDAFVAATAARQDYALDFRVRRADGEYRWVIDAGRPRFGPGGEFLGFIGSVIDITDRKLAEEERQRLLESERAARAEAERASRMKDEFLATLSHELRTPLNAILGWSQILARVVPDVEGDLAEGLRTIERNARAQTQIINDLLDMSRIIGGKLRLDVLRVDLSDVVREAVATAKPSADAKGVRLHAVLDPAAGPVPGDPARLQQVMWNLLSNAVKFTPRGGQVQVLLERVDSHVEVSVTDTGEGIPGEFLPFVFDRFRQADATATRRHGGLGLGLSIVKQLVELHGGSVRVSSGGAGRGATFTVSLPLSVIDQGPDPDAGGHHLADGSLPPVVLDACVELAGVRVLVVDDEPDARSLVKRLLEDCRGQVITASSAAEALDLVRAEKPDVLLCDVGMPGEDGFSLIRRVRALGPEKGGAVPAAALTAYARAEDRVRAVLAGFQMHLAKPVEAAELVATVASLAGRTGSTAPAR